MEFFQDKLQVVRNKLGSKGLDDPRLLGLLLIAVIGLSVVWNGARVVQQNYGLIQKITLLEEQNRILEIENRNKEFQNEYYKTAEFAELKARRVNGKALPGEQVYIVSRDAAFSSLKTPEQIKNEDESSNKPQYQQNFEAWMNFFFGDKSS